jgi:5-carboxymethyl-2-hydroxymuconate isomerase
MPLAKLEYTANLDFSAAVLTEFFVGFHQMMVEVIYTDLKTCKSSAVKFDHFCVADDQAEKAYVVLHIQILPGRTEEQIQALQARSAELLQKLLVKAGIDADSVSLRVLVCEADRSRYFMVN